MKGTLTALEPRDDAPAPADAPLVVVETDRSAPAFDVHLADWLAARVRSLPFPRRAGVAPALLRRRYALTPVQTAPEPRWHFAAMLPREAQVTSHPSGQPNLAVVELAAPRSRLVIEGRELAAEVRLPDWLDGWLAARALEPISSRPFLTATGVMGDVLAGWRTSSERFVGRFSTVRHGPRTFVVALRVPLEHYRDVARDFVLARDSLAPLVSLPHPGPHG
ncbi:MAG: hypothetical protein KDE27_02880 [Planctomycetes bacterium]|nr:hypothetical protein [Planctomycetota bacterium]